MKVLVTKKSTRLDHLGEYVRRKVIEGALSPDHLAHMKSGHQQHSRTFKKLERILKKHGIEYTEVFKESYWPSTNKFDAVITVGGDGTVLDASHHIDNDSVPIIGIKSADESVGHLCGCNSSQIEKMVLKLKEGTLKTLNVGRLQAKIHSINSRSHILSSPILNDALFCNTNPAATTRYRITDNETTEYQQSSGIWFASPAGSTAAISAAGGKKVKLTDKRYQYCVRELYLGLEPKCHLKKGFFQPGGRSPVIENLSPEAALYLDGHYNLHYLGFGDTIQFLPATSLKLVPEI